MINVRQLGEQLAQQDEQLRRTLEDLIAGATPGAELSTLLQVVAERESWRSTNGSRR